ncbi:molybdopterin molybdenumtransferase MoeA [Marinomonas piezotolerans]|uniref:Molybdopterin molybdenumtransferase n=1 Tax=Marinomonas piezotolerans TaxID=2213058 RepID=A0A370U4E7_9GAMM|nr:gephyrin-like molybdotransferase Glp [Marinomonas piezotolerans]RDL42664.1 molybdopterin molybdenumtransferase MoeA [Marinomonas piezotolerans]
MATLMPFRDAIEHIKQTLTTVTTTESVPLSKAMGRILAQDVISEIDVPPAANSAMDGFAVRTSDLKDNASLTVSQRIAAGSAPMPLQSGTCARIFTGAEIPQGADAVVMQENTRQQENQITFLSQPTSHDNIRPAGQDIAAGATVFTKGKRITAIDIGVLASFGITQVEVYLPLKVGILTTGDELQSPGTPLSGGQIYNSNGPLLESLVVSSGHQVSLRLHAIDSVEATQTALKALSDCSDVIISSGGVSVGEEDHVKATIEQNGQLHLWKIAIKPGKPLVFANVYNTPFLGLPGNPSSTLVTFHLFARLALAKAAGEDLDLPKAIPVKSGFSRKGNQSRDEFLRVHINNGIATPHAQQSSGALLAASQTDGYLHIPAAHNVSPNDEFDFYPFCSF